MFNIITQLYVYTYLLRIIYMFTSYYLLKGLLTSYKQKSNNTEKELALSFFICNKILTNLDCFLKFSTSNAEDIFVRKQRDTI